MRVQRYMLNGLAVIFIVTAGFAYKGNPNGSMKMWNDLKLTAEQQKKIKNLHNDMTALRIKHSVEIQEIRQKIVDELKMDNPSQEALDKYAQEMGVLSARQTQERNNYLLAMKEIFTSDQFDMMLDQQGTDGRGRSGPGAGAGRGAASKDCPAAKSAP